MVVLNTINNKQNNIHFSSLTKVFEKKVLSLPQKTAERMVDNYNRPNVFVGYFPDDIFQIMKNNNEPEKLATAIRTFNKAFAEQAKKIRNFDNKIIEKAKKLDIEHLLYIAIGSTEFYYIPNQIKYSLTNEEMENVLNNKEFSACMKNIGVLPEDGTVKFKFIGEGSFKRCFKVDFLDSNNNKLIHSKLFAVEKYPNLGAETNNIIRARLAEYINNTTLEDFTSMLMRKFENTNISTEEKANILQEIKKLYKIDYKRITIYNMGIILNDYFEINGIIPESNALLKMRHDLGKKISISNIIQPYIFDLKTKYGLLEFADDDLPQVQKHYDFDKYNLNWTDNKSKNTVGGRIIDAGCIFDKSKDYYDD